MNDYFNTPARVAALRAACESWRGTPYRARSLVKGPAGGVDCAGFVGACFHECGAIPEAIAVPPYAPNHAQHSADSILRAWLDEPAARARIRLLDAEDPHLDGDLVFPRVGRAEHHLGLRIGAIVYHIARPYGWTAMTVSQLQFHASRYRLIEA